VDPERQEEFVDAWREFEKDTLDNEKGVRVFDLKKTVDDDVGGFWWFNLSNFFGLGSFIFRLIYTWVNILCFLDRNRLHCRFIWVIGVWQPATLCARWGFVGVGWGVGAASRLTVLTGVGLQQSALQLMWGSVLNLLPFHCISIIRIHCNSCQPGTS
jgi:hypothetical protein